MADPLETSPAVEQAPQAPPRVVEDQHTPTPPEPTGSITEVAEGPPDGHQIMRFKKYLHLGEGAEECPGRDDGTCQGEEHFHAFCRIPNPIQHNDIREQAAAARARRIMVLRDPNSNARAIMEQELQQIALEVVEDIEQKNTLVQELLDKDWMDDYTQTTRTVEEDEEYEHIDADRKRLKTLEAEYQEQGQTLAPDTPQPEASDELKMLREKFEKYAAALETELKSVQQPKREALGAKPTEELIELVRKDRIENDGQAEFMHWYGFWTWFYGTCTTARDARGRHRTRYFQTEEELREAPAEVIEALDETYRLLEVSMQRKATLGNP